MKFVSPNSQILFLPGAGIGHDFGQIAPQIKSFDVYYDAPPVVGLDITDAGGSSALIVGLQITEGGT